MSNHLIRWGAAALLVVAFAQPARALPSGGAGEGFNLSFGQIWEHLIGSFIEVVDLWDDSRGTCDPNGGTCPTEGGGDSPDSRGTCDPNGGGCEG